MKIDESRTLATVFRDTVRTYPDRVALRWKDGDGWGEWTWSDYADRACRLAASLAALGVVPGERVVLMMRNRPEFNIADIATVLLGATPVSIYNSSAPEQVQYLASALRRRGRDRRGRRLPRADPQGARRDPDARAHRHHR